MPALYRDGLVHHLVGDPVEFQVQGVPSLDQGMGSRGYFLGSGRSLVDQPGEKQRRGETTPASAAQG